MEYLARRYAKYGYITATMSYTLLINNFTDYNIYKILDEITACIQSIKEELKSRNFDENKLEIALGGTSAGGHLAMLYSYSMKNSPIPLKFVIDIVGPVLLDFNYWYRVSDMEHPLDNIEPETIENALKENKIQKIFEDQSGAIMFMNFFLGNKYTAEDLKEMIVNGKINETNPKYQEMLNLFKYAFPINFVDENTLPTLCQYGGKDHTVGIAHYSYLYKAFKSKGIENRIKSNERFKLLYPRLCQNLFYS